MDTLGLLTGKYCW